MIGATLRRLESDVGELLAVHERGRDLSEFEGYRNDPCGFASDVLGVRLWSAQREILESLRDNRQTIALGAQGVGKDFAAAVGALWWSYARRGLVVATAATARQAEGVLHAEIVRLFRRAPDLPGEAFKAALKVPGAGGVVSFVSTESSKMTGWHHPNVLGLATEGQALEGWAFEALRACAVGPDDRLAVMANPLAPSGALYVAARSGRWQVFTIPATAHPNISGGEPFIPGGPSTEWIAEMRATYGESSPIYVARVQAEFPESGEDSLYRRSWIDAAVSRWRESKSRAAAGDELVVAVDPARFGPDSTGIAVRRGDVVLEVLAIAGQLDLMECVERVRTELHRLDLTPSAGYRRAGPGRVVVDEVGIGSGVCDRLRELGFRVTGFNGGSKPRDAERFLNLRAEAYWKLRERLEAGEIALPPDEELADELLATTWRPTADGKVALPPKDEIKARLGRSPDRADALAMAFGARGPVRLTFGD